MIFGKSPLEKALDRWAKQGGNFDEVSAPNINWSVKSASEAKAVCAALDALQISKTRDDSSTVHSSLHTLVAFFQQVDDEKAFEVFTQDGLPRLRQWVLDLLDGKAVDDDAVMFIMKILAMYHQREDVELIANVARIPFNSDGFMWSMILSQFDPEHPFANKMVDVLRDPLPTGFILVSYLDMANPLAIAGKLDRHPFDSDAGRTQLDTWLQDTNEENYSIALSATAALPFMELSARQRLLKAASEHPDRLVQMEAAWAQAKSGDSVGIAHLSEHCLDPRFSHTAQQYLEELGYGEEIPEAAREEGFQAVAEMANWLAHPMEFGRAPNTIELLDARELFWPPTNDNRRVSLVKYSYEHESDKTDVGVGMVGSVTFALFGETTADLSPEDIYALHCCWELEINGDERVPEVRTVSVGREILSSFNNGF